MNDREKYQHLREVVRIALRYADMHPRARDLLNEGLTKTEGDFREVGRTTPP